MDSQEKAPEMGMEKLQAEAVQEEQVVNEPQQVVADEVKEKKVHASKKEVVERVKEIAHGEENPQKEEVD